MVWETFGGIFAIMLLAELADKTQLVTFALATATAKPKQVYLGALGGLFSVTALEVLAGSLLALFVPLQLVQLAAGCAFVALGVYALFTTRRHEEEAPESVKVGKHVWARAFVLTFVAEFGDKTQIIAILAVAATGLLLVVFLAALLAMALVNAVSVFLGDRTRHIFGAKTIIYISGVAFILAGVLVLASALLPF
jgi:putative Ca2+/H+ antiporter (TMEM165/GDT1 family)